MIDLPRLRRPEYTGTNRCHACTVVNAAFLLVAVGVVGRWMPVLAIAVGVVGTAAIALRGYVVPFTPRFAPALVAPLPGEFFDHAAPAVSEALSDVADDVTDPEAVLRTLAEAGVVSVDGDQLGLRPGFEAAWRERMDALAAAPDDRLAATARDAIPAIASARVERTGAERFLVVTGEAGGASWIRRPVALAEVAAVEALRDTEFPSTHLAAAANALCAFLDTCPACGDELVEGRLDDCCGHALDGTERTRHGLACEPCGVVFSRFE